MTAMTPDKVEAALASLGIDAALVDEGLSYFHGSGDDGDKLYVSEIRKALSVLTEALAAKEAELNSLAARVVAEDCREKLIAASEKLPKDEWRAICAMFAECERINDALEDQLESTKEALAERERDAARYRFVRDGKSRGMVDLCITEVTWGDPAEHEILTDTKADTAIDAAMKETP